jgi:hypothetical protein
MHPKTFGEKQSTIRLLGHKELKVVYLLLPHAQMLALWALTWKNFNYYTISLVLRSLALACLFGIFLSDVLHGNILRTI